MTRSDFVASVRRLVVKVGTAVVSTREGTLDSQRVAELAGQVADLVDRGYQVAIVTSGAIGAGMGELGITERPASLPRLQAAASVGQSRLMVAYDESFKKHGLHAAQILLTREDFDSRTRYLNIRNLMHTLVEMRAIPVINENDAISVEEIRFGDNDLLSALVASLVGADLLVILSTVDGLLDANGNVVHTVAAVTEETRALDRGSKSSRGTGGMASKLEAAAMATRSGQGTLIANGAEPDVLPRLLAGEEVGTFFAPRAGRPRGRKRWFAARTTRGVIRVDEGAKRAVAERGKSLLPSGVLSVSGTFKEGDTVALAGPDGRTFAYGLTNLSSEDLARVRGMKSHQVRHVLGRSAYDEAVHRDNLLIRD